MSNHSQLKIFSPLITKKSEYFKKIKLSKIKGAAPYQLDWTFIFEYIDKHKHENKKKQCVILDVGCGSGTLLYLLREAGFSNVLGVDPHIDRDIKYNNGLRIFCQEVQEVKGSWDLIMFHHSFEHMRDPLKVLQSVSRLLAADGCCLIRIPVVSSFAWENYGVHWVQLDAPRHFFLHSLNSLRTLAMREKFHLEDIVFDSDEFQFWGSEQYKQGISLRSNRSYSVNPGQSIFSQKQMDGFQERAKRLNLDARGDQAAFYLKKD